PVEITSAAGFALAPARRPRSTAFRRSLVYRAKNALSEDLKRFSYQNFSGRCELLPSAAQEKTLFSFVKVFAMGLSETEIDLIRLLESAP
ncbi:unnamed protein product, partial [Musa textilis]